MANNVIAQRGIPLDEIKKKNQTSFAFTDREIDIVNRARNKRDKYEDYKINDKEVGF